MANRNKRPVLELPHNDEKAKKINEVIDTLKLPEEYIQKMITIMKLEMKQGLSKDEAERKKSSLQMENTFVRDICSGEEEGDFLALDLGGTNFRVLWIEMKNGVCAKSLSKNYNVPTETLRGPCIGVFNHLAESISTFMEEENIKDRHMQLGFTFSFPMIQESINKGILVTWTKSFKCPDGVGEDAVKLLNEAIERRGDISIDVTAILNDTTGTLMAGAYLDHKCQIGLILGTGSNAAYVEKIKNVDKWTGPMEDPEAEEVIDIEWGAFGDNGCLDYLKTGFDWEVDKHSNHVGSFTFEKLFGGLYLGEVTRLALVKFASEGLLFDGKVTEKLSTRWNFGTECVTGIDEDNVKGGTSRTKAILKELDIDASDEDVEVAKYLCEVLSIRAAQLVGTGLAVLLNHMNKPEVTVAIDGSLYRHHPRLHDLLMEQINSLAPDIKCKLILAEDGSGRGAGFVAAVVDRLNRQSNK